MTNWQKKCLASLMTSPEAYRMFYKTQKNKRYLHQFLCKYFRIQKETILISEIDKKYLKVLEYLKNVALKNTSLSNKIKFSDIVIDLEVLKECILEAKETIRDSICNNIFKLIFENEDKREFEISFGQLCRESSYDKLIDFIKLIPNKKSKLKYIYCYDYREADSIIYEKIYMIFKNYFEKANKRKIVKANYMNIGLEFEYDRSELSNRNEKEILQDILSILGSEKINENGIISFSQGEDGNSDHCFYNKDKKNLTEISMRFASRASRADEDRIRLNGFKGLKTLYKYIIWLNTFGKIPKDGSTIHIHIDCKYDNSIEDLNRKGDIANLILEKYLKCRKPHLLNFIIDSNKKDILNKDFPFDIPLKGKIELAGISDQFVRLNEIGTIEFRGFKGTFEYKYIIAYILTSSYIANCIKKGKRIENKEIKLIQEALALVY